MANLYFDMLDLSDMEECLAESDRGVLDSSLWGRVSAMRREFMDDKTLGEFWWLLKCKPGVALYRSVMEVQEIPVEVSDKMVVARLSKQGREVSRGREMWEGPDRVDNVDISGGSSVERAITIILTEVNVEASRRLIFTSTSSSMLSWSLALRVWSPIISWGQEG